VAENIEEDAKLQIDDVYLTNFDPVLTIEIDINISAQLNI